MRGSCVCVLTQSIKQPSGEEGCHQDDSQLGSIFEELFLQGVMEL